jgi:hypothetical protein
VSGCRHLRRLDAWAGLEVGSSCGHLLRAVLRCERGFALIGWSAVAVVVALRLDLCAAPVPALIVARTTDDVVTGDFGQLRLLALSVFGFGRCALHSRSYLCQKSCVHHQQFPASLRLREVRASSLLLVAMGATGGVLFGTKVDVVVAGVVECRGWKGRWGQRSHVHVRVDSMRRRVVVGRLPVPARCRVPYWQDASPWSKRASEEESGCRHGSQQRLRNKQRQEEKRQWASDDEMEWVVV